MPYLFAKPAGLSVLSPSSAGVISITSDVAPAWQPLAGLTSWWRADGNALDAIGTNHATLSNGAAFAAGKFGEAFSLDGVGGKIVVPHGANLNAGTAITVAAWVNPASMGHGRPIAQKRSSGNIGGYTFETTDVPEGPDDALQWVVWINGTPVTLQTPPQVLQPGVWRHVAATYDGAAMKIFVDGTLRAIRHVAGAVDDTNEPFVIGPNALVPSLAWHGLLDEVEIYHRPLADAEIQALASRAMPDPAGQPKTVNVMVLPTPAATPTAVFISSSDPAVATATSGPIAAGSQTATLTITAGQVGTTTLTVRAGTETRVLTVVVGTPASNTIPLISARPVGVSTIRALRAGELFAPTGAVRTIRVVVLGAPAAADTPVTITSSDPGIVSALSPAVVSAGEQTVDVQLTTNNAGKATLTLSVGGQTLTLEVAVGIDVPAERMPLVTGPPVGVSVVRAGSAGHVIAPEGAVSLPTVRVPLLTSPAAAPVQVTVTTGAASIVSLGGSTSIAVTIAQGGQTVDLPLSIAGTRGMALLFFEFEGQRREMLVVVGEPPNARLPLLSAPVVGVEIR
jgi:hypothetical protein